MGTESGDELSDLKQDLAVHGPHYDFTQACRLLRTARVPFRLRPAAECSFPSGEIRRIHKDDANGTTLEVNFLGLYGVDSPLPSYFSEEVLRQEPGKEPLRAFLDIFHQRLYELLFESGEKFRPCAQEQSRSWYDRYLDAFAGKGISHLCPDERPFAGLLGGYRHSAEGLRGILEEFLQVPVRIRQFVPTAVRIDNETSLGSGLRLGQTILLGNRLIDRSQTVEITLGPVSLEKAQELGPEPAKRVRLSKLIRSYIPITMEPSVRVELKPPKAPPPQLGRADLIMGWSFWLGEKRSSATLHCFC